MRLIRAGICLWALLVQVALCPIAAAAGVTVTVQSVTASAFPRVSATVNVLNPQGIPYNGLTKQQFTVLEDDKPVTFDVQPTVDNQEPIAVALVIDVSGSMNDGGKLDSAKQAANALIDVLTARDTMAIVSFADTVEPVEGFTNDKARLKAAVAGLKAKGATLLYDAVATSAGFTKMAPQRRKVLLVLTDGEDETSKRYTLDSAIAATRDAQTSIFAVGLGKDVKREPVERLAKDTSGQSVFVTSTDQLRQTFLSFSEQLRRQYLIQYTSSLVADGKTHTVTVRVNVQNETGEGKGTFALSAPPTRPAATATATVTATATATATRTATPPVAAAAKAPTQVSPTAVPTPTPCSGLGCAFGPQSSSILIPLIAVAALVLIGLVAWFAIRASSPLAMQVKGIQDGARIRRGDVVHIEVLITSGRARRVDLLVDDQPLGAAQQFPFTIDWDSDDATDGRHTVVVRAVGAVGTKLERAFVITKADDVTVVDSQVRFDVRGVRDGEQVTGEVRLEVVVSRGIASRVELLVDGKARDERRTAPYVFAWNPSGLSGGHQLLIRVADSLGTVSEKRFSVTVAESRGTVLFGESATLQISFRGRQWQHELAEGETLLGRKPDGAGAAPRGSVLFEDPERSIHRDHARITRQADGFWIENRGAKGTKVNGQTITQRRRLSTGDRIEICDAVLVFSEANRGGSQDGLETLHEGPADQTHQ